MANAVDTTVLEKFIGCSPGQLTQLIREFVEAPGTNKIKEALINNNLDAIYSQLKLDQQNKATKRLVVISESLTYDEEGLLKSTYPEFEFSFLNRNVNTHAFAAASRRCETELLLSRVDESGKVIDVGGNFYYHFRNGAVNIHSDCPIVSVRDSQRWSTRVTQVVRMVGNLTSDQVVIYNDIRSVVDVGAGNYKCRPSLCNQKFHQCPFKAPYAISVHSLYDIPIKEVMIGMIKRGVHTLYASIIFDSKILVQRKGKIDGINAHYEWDMGRDIITFAFENDSSLVYRHSFKNYLQYFVNPYLHYSVDGVTSDFVIELLENRNGVQFLKISRCVPCGKVDDGYLVVRHWLSSVKKKKILKYFEFGHDKEITWSEVFMNMCKDAEVRAQYFFVDSELIERGMDFAYRATDKFKPLEIYNYMQSLNRRIFVGGKEVLHREMKESAEVLYKAANVIYLEVFARKYDIGQILSDLKAGMEYNRRLAKSTLFEKIFSSSRQCLRGDDPRYASAHGIFGFIPRLHRKLYSLKKCKVPEIEDFSQFATVPLDKLATAYERTSLSRLIYDPVEYLEYDATVNDWMKFLRAWLNVGDNDRLVYTQMPVATPAPLDVFVALRDFATKSLLQNSRVLENEGLDQYELSLLKFNVLDLRDYKFVANPNASYRSQFFENREFTICPISGDGDCQIRAFVRAFRGNIDRRILLKLIEKFKLSESFSCCGDVVDEVLVALRDGSSPSLNLLVLLTQLFPVAFIIHSELDRNYYLIGVRQDNEVHLLLRHSHVDLLLPRSNEYDFQFDLDAYSNSLLLGPLYRPIRERVFTFLKNVFGKLCNCMQKLFEFIGSRVVLVRDKLLRVVEWLVIVFARFSFKRSSSKVFRYISDLYSRLSGEEAALIAWVDNINKNIKNNQFNFEIGEDVVNEIILDLLDDVSKSLDFIDKRDEFDRMLQEVEKSLVLTQGNCETYSEVKFTEVCDEFVHTDVVDLTYQFCEPVIEREMELFSFDDVVDVRTVDIHNDVYADGLVATDDVYHRLLQLYDYDLNIDRYRNYEKLRCFYNKAAYKLYAILNEKKIKNYFSLIKDTVVVDIGGAPGGFLQVLTCLGYKVYSVSLGEYKVCLGERHIDRLASHCGYPRTRMIVADAADQTAYFDNETFDDSMIIARRILEVGGLIVIKHSNFFFFKNQFFVRDKFLGFKRVYILKPAFSYMRSTEIYFVAVEYDGVSIPEVDGFETIKLRFSDYVRNADQFLRTNVPPPPLSLREMSDNINLSLSLPNHVYNIKFLNDEDRMVFVAFKFSVSYDKGIKVYSLDILNDVQPLVDDTQIYVVCDAKRDPSQPISRFFTYLRSYPFDNDKIFVCYLRNNEVANTVDIKNFSCIHLLALSTVYSGSDRIVPWEEFVGQADKVFHKDYDYHYVMYRGKKFFFCYGVLKVRPKYTFTSDEKYRNFLLYYSSVLQAVESTDRMFYLSVYCCVSKYSVRCIDGMQIRTVGFNAVAEFYVMLRVSREKFVRRVSDVSFEVGVNELTDEELRDLQFKLPRGNTLTVTMDEGIEERMVERCFSDLFSTIYIRNFDDDERSIDFVNGVVRAVSEVRSMWQARVNAVMKEFESVYASLRDTKFLGTCTLQHIGVIDTISGIWQKKPTVRTEIVPTVGYDGVEIINVKYNRTAQRFEFSHATRSRFVIVSTRVEMFNEPMLLERTEGLDTIEVARAIGEFVMYAGAPGSGKSTAILSGMNKGTQIDISDICITANRDTVEDLRRRAVDRGYCDSDEYLKRKFRTFESLILNSKESCVDLWIDEAYMRPPGQVFMCALITRARKIHMFCDFAQIPFINRDRLISMCYNDFKSFSWKTECRSHTYRCPRDVVALMNIQKYYPFTVTGSNPRVNSMHSPIYIMSVVEIPQIQSAHYLTFIQDDKNILKSKGFKNVNTIHEYQGEENADIILVRITTKNYEVHNSAPHLLVAFTRHTVSFKYYTTVRDRMCALIEMARSSDQHRFFKPISAAGIGADSDWELGFPVDYQLELEKTVRYEDSSKLARSIVSLNAGADVTCLSVVPLNRVDVMRGLEYGVDFGPSLGKEYLQMLYDDIFPGASIESRANDQWYNERGDVSFSECMFVLGGDARNYLKEREYMVPYLRTSIQADVQETPQSVVHAFSERNGGAPDYLGDINSDYVHICVRQFETTYIRDMNLYATFKANPINLNSYMIDGWFRTQKGEVLKQVSAADLDLSVYQLQVYEFMLKRNPKPILDATSTTKISAPQTIAFHKKLVNAVFCPIVREIKKRLLCVLGHNVQVFTDMSIAEFETRLNTFMRPAELRHMPFTKEIDFSKFDKSQWDKVLLIEIRLLLNLGFPSELVHLWLYMYYHTVLINRSVRFKALVEYQRKSGSPLTFLGNTFFSMVCIAVVFRNCREFHEMRKAFLFAGDDVFIFLEKFVKIDMLDFELTFNLEAKLLEYKYFYFCSKFLLPIDEDMWKVVPDPAKLLTKLGRHDLVSYEHVNEYRISVRDLIKQLASSNCLHILENAMEDRYGVVTGWEPFVATMLELTSSIEKFFELYSDKEISILTKLKRKLSSKMPNLDI